MFYLDIVTNSKLNWQNQTQVKTNVNDLLKRRRNFKYAALNNRYLCARGTY